MPDRPGNPIRMPTSRMRVNLGNRDSLGCDRAIARARLCASLSFPALNTCALARPSLDVGRCRVLCSPTRGDVLAASASSSVHMWVHGIAFCAATLFLVAVRVSIPHLLFIICETDPAEHYS